MAALREIRVGVSASISTDPNGHCHPLLPSSLYLDVKLAFNINFYFNYFTCVWLKLECQIGSGRVLEIEILIEQITKKRKVSEPLQQREVSGGFKSIAEAEGAV